jgi:Asp-tRNA(Asn)/Glu-tRNA(Gln) amidotransferase A subunit family amidase
MARTVGDLRVLLGALSSDPFGRKAQDLRGVRVAWYTDDDVAPVTEETARAVATAAQALRDAGLKVEAQRPPHVERGNELWLKMFSRASVLQLRNVYKGREREGGSFVSWRLSTADNNPPPTLDEYIAGWMERDRLREELLQWMETTPLIVAPVGATPAYQHDTLKVTVRDSTFGTFKAFSYAQTFSVFDLPVVTVPAGKSNEGLPIGVQIAGTPFAEEMVLQAAQLVEKALSTDSTGFTI